MGVGVGVWDKSWWVGKLKKYLRIVTKCDRSVVIYCDKILLQIATLQSCYKMRQVGCYILRQNIVTNCDVVTKLLQNCERTNRHAPIQKKLLMANEVPYITKILRNAIRNRSRHGNRYYKTNSVEDNISYKRQKNYRNRKKKVLQ